jgi:hypothetical protein
MFEEPNYLGLADNLNLYTIDELSNILEDPSFKAFAELYPEQAEILRASASSDTGLPSRGGTLAGGNEQSIVEVPEEVPRVTVIGTRGAHNDRDTDIGVSDLNVLGNLDQSVKAETAGTNKGPNVLGNRKESVEAETAGTSTGTQLTGLPELLEQAKNTIKNITGFEASDVLKTAFLAALAKFAYDDAREAREAAKGAIAKPGDIPRMQAVRGPDGGVGFRPAAEGGLMSVTGMVDPIRTAQRIMTDPQVQQRFEGYLIDELQRQGYAEGGVARYFAGGTDGMADQIPAQIENQRPAALSDGEFVIPADVVSHLGNGNSTAGAKRLYEMMDRIREARTGTTKQGQQIDANDFTLG